MISSAPMLMHRLGFQDWGPALLFSVMMATIMFVMVPRAAVSADRIQDVLDTEPSVNDPVHPTAATGTHGYLEFKEYGEFNLELLAEEIAAAEQGKG